MSTKKQTDANRRNARRSTGPKTDDGKAASARNSLKHGLLARDATLPSEDQKAVVELFDALEAEFHPVGPLEEFFAHQMASAQWRLQRLTRLETGLIEATVEDENSHHWNDDLGKDKRTPAVSYEAETLLMGQSMAHGTLGKDLWTLGRYENIIRRSFYQALAELQRLQKQRAAQPNQQDTDKLASFSPPPDPAPQSTPHNPQPTTPSPIGDRVLLPTEGYSAMTAVGRPQSPIDMAVIGVIDSVKLT